MCRSTTMASFGLRFRREASAFASKRVRDSARSDFAAAIPSTGTSTPSLSTIRRIRKRHLGCSLVDGPLDLREGVVLRVDLGGLGETIVGYRAIKNSDVINVNRVRGYAVEDFWEPIHAREDRRLILDPDQFYILASREKVQIPADLAAEMAPIDPAIGEFRVHYAGFFDPGFGQGADGWPSARAVLEVRSRDVPFLLEDGQPVGRLVYEKLAGAPDELYGAGPASSYQHQGLQLSKHFRAQ